MYVALPSAYLLQETEFRIKCCISVFLQIERISTTRTHTDRESLDRPSCSYLRSSERLRLITPSDDFTQDLALLSYEISYI